MLFNSSTNVSFDLSNWRFDGLGYVFPDNTIMAPRTFLLLAKDRLAFAAAYGTVSPASYAQALQRGRDLYVGQACWHCHSQYVRVVSNEPQRWGPASTAQEYQNALNQPHLWGTRRVGPDLSRQGGTHTNDWHVAHFANPKDVVPSSVMPTYRFLLDDAGAPTRDGMAVITYLQWLGTQRVPVSEGGETP